MSSTVGWVEPLRNPSASLAVRMIGIAEPVIGRRFAPTRWFHPSYAPVITATRNPETLRCLLQGQHQSAQIQADDQAVLLAGERQHGAALVGEDDGLRALDGGCAGAGLGVDAGNVGRAADIADGAMEVRLRGAEGEAVTQAPDRQRIAAALERQHGLSFPTSAGAKGISLIS